MKYFRILDNLDRPSNRWFLSSLNVVDDGRVSVWKFVTASATPPVVDTTLLTIGLRSRGTPIDFTFADFEVPIINEQVATLIPDEDAQLLPVQIAGHKANHHYFVAFLMKEVDCLDANNSIYELWDSDDAVRPDLAGEIKSIDKLIIDSTKVTDATIFRLYKSDNIVIANEIFKRHFENAGLTGLTFKPVT
jgi:hypothetical protein